MILRRVTGLEHIEKDEKRDLVTDSHRGGGGTIFPSY